MLTAYIKIDIEVFSFLILLMIRLNHGFHRHERIGYTRAYLLLLECVLLQTGLDIVSVLLNGINTPNAILAAHAVNWLGYTLDPLVGLFWLYYVILRTNTNHPSPAKRWLLWLQPIIVTNLILVTMNLWTGWFYSIDEFGYYHRGPYLPVHTILSYFSLLTSFLHLVLHRKQVKRGHLFTMISFTLLPMVGMVMQYYHYGVLTIWPCITLGLLLVQLNMQNQLLQIDHLTGVYNRRQLDRYLAYRVENALEHPFAAILLDVDNFKTINDTLGHPEGDAALCSTVRILQSCLRRNDFIARYGGDEFVLLLQDCPSDHCLQEVVNRISDALISYNNCEQPTIPLSVSMGYALYDPQSTPSADHYLRLLDSLMYKSKETYRNSNLTDSRSVKS